MSPKTISFAAIALALTLNFAAAQVKRDPSGDAAPPRPTPSDYRATAVTQELSACLDAKIGAVSKVYELADQNRALQAQVDDLTKKLADAAPKKTP